MAVDIPHFALPLRYVNGKPLVNQQDSIQDVADCVRGISQTIIGEIPDLPEFGVLDNTFEQEPFSAANLVSMVATWEPRAEMVASNFPNQFEAAIYNINVEVSTGQSI